MDPKKKHLIIIAGPTAVGKSSLALELAAHFSTEILSADSRQIYRKLDIGTAKPTIADRERIPHHLIDVCDITERFTAANYERAALAVLKRLFEQMDVAVACGGTGLYLRVLTQGLDDIPDVPTDIRTDLDKAFALHGIEPLQRELKSTDPQYYDQVDLHNPRRLIRALSVIRHTGSPFSQFLLGAPQARPFDIIPMVLQRDREVLYERINQRVDQMLLAGLEEEAHGLRAYADQPAMQTVGYQEWFPYFAGRYDRAEVVRLIKRNTRRYAKRQLTWLRKYGDWRTFDADRPGSIQAHLAQLIQ